MDKGLVVVQRYSEIPQKLSSSYLYKNIMSNIKKKKDVNCDAATYDVERLQIEEEGWQDSM